MFSFLSVKITGGSQENASKLEFYWVCFEFTFLRKMSINGTVSERNVR